MVSITLHKHPSENIRKKKQNKNLSKSEFPLKHQMYIRGT